MVFSASSVLSLEMTGNESMFSLFKKQLMFVIVGVVLAIVVSMSDYKSWKPYLIWLNAITITLLILVGFTGLGVEVNGATRWLNVFSFQFQPSELAKITIILTVSSMIDEAHRYNKLNTVPTLSRIGMYVLFYGALIGIPQNHASVVMIIILTVSLLLFFGGINRYLFFGTMSAGVVAGLAIGLSSPFRRQRMLTFLNPLEDSIGDGYQIAQNWFALGSGELLGVGLGYGRQKFGWLPEDHTDFILGIIGEELGFAGIFILLILFFFLIARGFFISINSKDNFGLLISSGIMSLIAVQVVINSAVISGLFPVTGIPLPFISYGGTYTISLCVMMGIMMSVYRRVDEDEMTITEEVEDKLNQG